MARSISFAIALSLLSPLVLAQGPACKTPPANLSLDVLSKGYPAVGQIADIVQGDDEAQDLYQKMLAEPTLQTLLKVAPKGTPANSAQGVKYADADPDCWWTWNQCLTPKAPGLAPDISTCAEASTWGLTFDDGPYCGQGRLLDFLDQNKQKATFFLIGANVMQDPVEAQDLLNRGHEICGHSWSHHYTTALTNSQVFAELYYTKKAIKQVVGVTTRCWRAPYGDVDDRVRAIAAYLDSRTVLWDQDTDDWSIDDGASPATIQANFAKIISTVPATGHGTIVLDHSISEKLIDMFISQYPLISKAFQHIMPALTCANWTTPYYETDIVYPDYATYVSGGSTGTYNATVDPNLSNGKLLFGNVTNEQAVPAAASASSSAAASKNASASSAGAAATGGSGIKAQSSSDSHSGANVVEVVGKSIVAIVVGAVMTMAVL